MNAANEEMCAADGLERAVHSTHSILRFGTIMNEKSCRDPQHFTKLKLPSPTRLAVAAVFFTTAVH